jgi:putative iron-only hydrogenase system regulator
VEETRLAVIAIIVKSKESVEALNELLHQYSDFIIGRMGVPYRAKGLNVISVVLDAPNQAISSLAGKIGRLKGVTAKAVYSNPDKA